MKKKELKKHIKELKARIERLNKIIENRDDDYETLFSDWGKLDGLYQAILHQIVVNISDDLLDREIKRIRDSRTSNWGEFMQQYIDGMSEYNISEPKD